MPAPRSEFLAAAFERGFVHQVTDEAALDAKAAQGRLVAYIRFDCTADSLHGGTLGQIMMLRRLQSTPHKSTLLRGGGTTKLADPTGRLGGAQTHGRRRTVSCLRQRPPSLVRGSRCRQRAGGYESHQRLVRAPEHPPVNSNFIFMGLAFITINLQSLSMPS